MERKVARSTFFTGLALVVGFGAIVAARPEATQPLAIDTAKVTIAGTSNIHAYSASTTTVRVTRVAMASNVAGPAFWDALVKPGALTTLEVAIPAAQLSSAKEGLDKNMHKALKVQEHADITFRLTAVETGSGPGALKARGVLRIAGTERDVVLDLITHRHDTALTVKGKLDLLMTDYGIKPPTAMMGMLKTDPKVTVSFDVTLAVPLT